MFFIHRGEYKVKVMVTATLSGHLTTMRLKKHIDTDPRCKPCYGYVYKSFHTSPPHLALELLKIFVYTCQPVHTLENEVIFVSKSI